MSSVERPQKLTIGIPKFYGRGWFKCGSGWKYPINVIWAR